MKTVAYFVFLFMAGLCLFCAGGSIVTMREIPAYARMGHLIFFLAFLASGISLFWLSEYFRTSIKWLPQEPDQRPIVRVWTVNGTTRVIPESLWQIQRQLHRLECLAGIAPRDQRLDPNISIVFSNDPAKADWVTGDMQEYSKLLAGCVVEKTDMYVPVHRRHTVTPTGAWKLVHGPDAKPPVTS